jgi:hypothetical protein
MKLIRSFTLPSIGEMPLPLSPDAEVLSVGKGRDGFSLTLWVAMSEGMTNSTVFSVVSGFNPMVPADADYVGSVTMDGNFGSFEDRTSHIYRKRSLPTCDQVRESEGANGAEDQPCKLQLNHSGVCRF